MKAFLHFGCLPFALMICLPNGFAAPASTNQPAPRLTVELRDGSRVVGQSVDGTFQFQSALLGELKLAVTDVRSIDCFATNSAKLMAANGDELSGWFVNHELRLQTSFGRIELAVDSIRRLSVSTPDGAARSGLVALWSGEGNGDDTVGGNNAVLTDMTFADGKIGRAFSLNGFSSCARIPASPSLDVGKGGGLTIMAWIKPSNIFKWHPIVEWNDNSSQCGVHLWIGQLPSDNGVLYANIIDTAGQSHTLRSSRGALIINVFQHVALTYDRTTGVGALFVNGAVVDQQNQGSFTPQTSFDIWISRRPDDHPGDWTYQAFFAGLLDEISIYNRALAASEIEAIGMEENQGQLLPAPTAALPANARFGDHLHRDLPEN